jgi:transposase InsO family protein
LSKTEPAPRTGFTGEQKLLILDAWKRSSLPATDFAPLVGVTTERLYAWKRRFEAEGPAGLEDRRRGGRPGSRLPEATKRAILMLKEANPDFGCERISDVLARGPGLGASASAVGRVLHEAGYVAVEAPTRPHAPQERRFERARPNQLWQTDLFTFLLKRQNRRVYLVGFLDDHSRFMVSYGLHASQSGALVREVLRAGIASYGVPEEVLTDNGAQYVTWRGKSAFARELEQRGIRHVVAAPRHPRTLGKIERFWGSLWRECLETALFLDLEDARRRIGFFMDHYNFLRTHEGIGGLVPADRYFGAESEMRRTLAARVAANALELARHGRPRKPFYVTGRVGDQAFSVHAEGERVILTRADGAREEVALEKPEAPKTPVELSVTAPAETGAELPSPVCPVGIAPDLLGEDLPEAPAPGESGLDPAARPEGETSEGGKA